MTRIQNFSNRAVSKISWDFFRTYPICDKLKLNEECFNLLSDAALDCLDTLTDNLSSPIDFTPYKSKISSWLFNGSSRNTKVITNQILIAKYARITNPSIDKLQRAGISEEINTKRIELAARRLKTSCLTTHTSKTSTELLLGCFYGQLRLTKQPNYGPAKPCQICNTFESYTIETNAIFHTFYSCPLATFMIQICELYSITIFGHRIQINLNGMILLEFSKKDMTKTTKNQRRVFYTILSIAKSTLFSLYYNRVGNITESRVCKLFCVNLAKTRAVLPSALKQDFKHILDFEFNPSIHKSIKFFLQQEQYNIRRIQNDVNNINSLALYKSHMEEKRKKERTDWVLHRGLRREVEIARNHRKPYSEQKMSYVIEIMFSKAGLVMKQI